MNCKATFIDEHMNRTTIEGEAAMAMLMQKKPYRGVPKLKTLPHLKPGYKSKNPSGGRACVFAQSPAYKRFCKSYEYDTESLLNTWIKGMAGLYRDSLSLAIRRNT